MTAEGFEQVYGYDNLFLAAMQAFKEKDYRNYKRKFYGRTGERLDEKLIILQNELIWKAYRVQPIIRRVKGKLTALPSFLDRVVQIATCNVLRPTFEQFYISDNYAFRGGALERLGDFMRRRENEYYLKCRIKNLYESVKTRLLVRTVCNRYISDKNILWLIKTMHDGRHPGMRVSRLDRILINAFCVELDRYIKVELQTPCYLRCVDEFIVFSDDYAELSCMNSVIEKFLYGELGLKLDGKTIISKVKYGVWFFGRRIGKKADIPF